MDIRGRIVTVTVPREVAFDLKKIQKIQEEVVTRLGHSGCYSGFDVLFRMEQDYIVDRKSFELHPVAVQIG
jgi:hypothetical protein